ncbi:unnamed protein product [Rangifer tarandus platyrhynchus]|uniref:Uncharacterized protein n=1 Tax=Rangifer tarandus platyrhynchus TaxID=3082113 RepID=A0ABN8ZYJ1_RANTA|nr:unnamed protein product [Rangifer tarandus platyrhynchus]
MLSAPSMQAPAHPGRVGTGGSQASRQAPTRPRTTCRTQEACLEEGPLAKLEGCWAVRRREDFPARGTEPVGEGTGPWWVGRRCREGLSSGLCGALVMVLRWPHSQDTEILRDTQAITWAPNTPFLTSTEQRPDFPLAVAITRPSQDRPSLLACGLGVPAWDPSSSAPGGEDVLTPVLRPKSGLCGPESSEDLKSEPRRSPLSACFSKQPLRTVLPAKRGAAGREGGSGGSRHRAGRVLLAPGHLPSLAALPAAGRPRDAHTCTVRARGDAHLPALRARPPQAAAPQDTRLTGSVTGAGTRDRGAWGGGGRRREAHDREKVVPNGKSSWVAFPGLLVPPFLPESKSPVADLCGTDGDVTQSARAGP